MVDKKQLMEHEMKHLSKEYRTNRDKMSDILHTDFYEVGVSGREYYKNDILDAIPLDTAEYTMKEFSYKVDNDKIITEYRLIKNNIERRTCKSTWAYESNKLKLLTFESKRIKE